MAVAANEVQAIVSQRWPIGSGRAIYVGTCQGGTGYATGGAVMSGGGQANEEANGSRHKFPEKVDYVSIGAPLGSAVAGPNGNKVKLFAETTVGVSTETPLSELKNAATMATAIPAGTPFMAIGDA